MRIQWALWRFFYGVCYPFLYGEVGNISLLKKVRPELDADPTELGFKKEYFDRLDEFEKEKVGRTSYKTISAMAISYIIVFVICWVLFSVLLKPEDYDIIGRVVVKI